MLPSEKKIFDMQCRQDLHKMQAIMLAFLNYQNFVQLIPMYIDTYYTQTTFTCDQYDQHFVMDTFLNANIARKTKIWETWIPAEVMS